LLRLILQVKNKRLRVRQVSPHESLVHPKIWNNEIEFEYSADSDYMMAWTSLLPDLDSKDANRFLNMVGARYPMSENFLKLQAICPELTYPVDVPEWVFYGGTFNPWHKGHQACLNLLPEDLTCFILPDNSPHKELRELNPVVTILELSTKARFSQNQYLVPSFILNKKTNPTVEWIEVIKKRFPFQELSLLIGFDSLENLPSWTRVEDLLPLLKRLYVISRLEDDTRREMALKRIKDISSELEIIFLGRHEFEKLSSTELRSK